MKKIEYKDALKLSKNVANYERKYMEYDCKALDALFEETGNKDANIEGFVLYDDKVVYVVLTTKEREFYYDVFADFLTDDFSNIDEGAAFILDMQN